MAPMSPMIAVIIGLIPAEIEIGMAITGMMARHGIEPGPTALSTMPIRNITNGIIRAGTLFTIFFASSSSVPFPLIMAKRYVTPTICTNRDVLNPETTSFVESVSGNSSVRIMAKPMLKIPTFTLRTKPITMAASRRIREITAKFIFRSSYANTMQTGLPVGMMFRVGNSWPVAESNSNSTMVSLSSFATKQRPFGAKQKKRGVFPRQE